MSLARPRDISPATDHRHLLSGMELSQLLLGGALEHAARGYPVLPRDRDKAPTHRGRVQARTDPDWIRRWWGKWPHANIGAQITDLGIVVLDEDGGEGRYSMVRLLDEAGVPLPETYTVTTGRDAGGRHLWFRLPPGRPPLVTQYGHPDRHPGLDVKFNGIVVGAWSLHRSGRHYQPNQQDVPMVHGLSYLPDEIYQVLLQVGRAAGARSPAVSRPQYINTDKVRRLDASAIRPSLAVDASPRPAGKYLRSLLADTSDGRNTRCFTAVLRMVLEGYSDTDVARTLLAHPLGDKAREQTDIERFIKQKIDSARAAAGTRKMPDWDLDTYWTAVHCAGLNSAQTRLLDFMMVRGIDTGTVTLGQAMLGIRTALSPATVASCLDSLAQKGWILRLRQGNRNLMLPARYGLTIPTRGQNPYRVLPPGMQAPRRGRNLMGSSAQNLSLDLGHDAFHPARGSLHRAYPVLCILDCTPRSTMFLSEWLGCSQKTVQRMVGDLRRAGLLVSNEVGEHRLAEISVGQLLDTVAAQAGTVGARHRAQTEYHDKCEQWDKDRVLWKQDAAMPGTAVWREVTRRYYAEQVDNTAWSDLLATWTAAGRSKDDIITDLVASEERAMTADPIWIEEP